MAYQMRIKASHKGGHANTRARSKRRNKQRRAVAFTRYEHQERKRAVEAVQRRVLS